MKVVAVVAAILALCCPLTVVADLDDLIPALILGNAMRCSQYGCSCNGKRCCQYRGYGDMTCRNGQCLQQQCASVGQRCSNQFHCCYHEGLTCFPMQSVCGYSNNGKK